MMRGPVEPRWRADVRLYGPGEALRRLEGVLKVCEANASDPGRPWLHKGYGETAGYVRGQLLELVNEQAALC